MRQFSPMRDIAQYLGAGADHDVVADRGMPFTVFLAGAAQGHALVQRDIVAHDRGLADDHAHAVIDEEAPANLVRRDGSRCR